MAQINRIRVNNVKYNFGTQFYDDFLMRFSGKNTIYDLANGGGKSVLMLLLLQNMLPNCTLDDKQPIEKLFRSGNGNTTIHSLVEWKLDSCDVKNGYRYMTTGFCARKGRDNAEENNADRETANIEYFNYCIFYREFGENDIKNFPLAKDGERVTYNGLKSYLRDLERKDLGVSVRIFDKKGDYQNFISNYGLYESQWEIVRGINKTEGHVRTYFESNYKTTRKVIEDLLIEEIIEKSYNNRIRKNSEAKDDEEMARTLLDIKDKLMELSKRKGEINRYDEQIAILSQFSGQIGSFCQLYEEKEMVEQKLIEALCICRGKADDIRKRMEILSDSGEEFRKTLDDEARLIALAEIETELSELDKLNNLINDTLADRKIKSDAADRIKDELYLRENALDYKDYLANRKLYDETREMIQNSNRQESVLLEEMAMLAATKNGWLTTKKNNLINERQSYEEQLKLITDSYNKSLEEQQKLFGKIKMIEGIMQNLEEIVTRNNDEMSGLMQGVGLIVAEQAWDKCEKTAGDIKNCLKRTDDIENLIKEKEALRPQYVSESIEREAKLAKLCEEEKYLKSELEHAVVIYEKLNKIKYVYGQNNYEQLEKTVESLLYRLNRERNDAEKELEKLNEYLKSIQEQKIPEYDMAYNNVLKYLKSRYGEDVVSGREVLEGMEEDSIKVMLEDFPQLPYVIFVNGSYEKIIEDKVLSTLNTESCIIPVLRMSVLEEHVYPFEKDNVISVCKDMSFLWNESALAAEIQKVSEDIVKYEEIVRKTSDKCQMVTEDNVFIKSVKGQRASEDIQRRIEEIQREKTTLFRRKEDEIIKSQELSKQLSELKASLEKEREFLSVLQKDIRTYEQIAMLNDALIQKYKEIKDNENSLSEAKKEYSHILHKSAHEQMMMKQAQTDFDRIKTELEEIENDFTNNVKPYLKENTEIVTNLTRDEVDARMSALVKLIKGENGDISDKERLLASYEAAMKKSADNIVYRGMTMDEAHEAYESGRLYPCKIEEMLQLKNEKASIDKEIRDIDSQLDSQSAQKNRMEGSIEHGKRRYEDKYGEFVRENITNPQNFIVVHRHEMSRIQQQIQETESIRKKLENDNRDILFMEKDIERIIRNAGLEIPEDGYVSDLTKDITSEDYEKLQKQYDSIRKEENRLLAHFNDERQKVADALAALEAYELSAEMKNSVIAPKTSAEATELIKGISDTNGYIALERDRIEKSISDMEKIKDSFENRCIQICSNIKTELERLPKLSRITLDDEVISIITLSIPYIKEEMYKDRMSVYINETVAGAETFNNPAEKLKYMKNRLSWKKMFSVIVTDMNSIKLCLYKREHIKDQSRYLKYEEALGSTGQSQGIYIQFLIAVINYIASLNAMDKDNSVTGKTIFIDNPFGAAKDVYIWEPIFKLLKTNHVQLIVPARGATPAITKMFDVNYILGQKMVANRQQTVVVDYRSQVKTEEMEYEVMEYEQTMLDIV